MHRDDLPIPSPCHADWNAMEVRDRARHCASCALDVIDISAHTETEARALAHRPRTGRICVSYVVRPDGSLKLAKDPLEPDVPLRSLTRRAASVAVAASLALVAACHSPRLAGAPSATTGEAVSVTAPLNASGNSDSNSTPPDSGTTTPTEPCDPGTTDERIRGEMRLGGAIAPPPPPPEGGDQRIEGKLELRE